MSHLPFDFIADKENNTLTIRRTFNAHRQLVWDAYTQSELLDQWFAPTPLVAKTKSMDFRNGGRWHYAMIEPNGTAHWGLTEFIHISPIDYYTSSDAFCNEAGEINTQLPRAQWVVTFIDKGENTVVESVVTYAQLSDLETIIKMGMQEGMRATLLRLDNLLETLSNIKQQNMPSQKITVQALIAADLKKTWDYYTNPEHITQWNFADPSWCCPKAENDLQVGGKYNVRMEAKDGSFGFDFEGIYTEMLLEEKYTLVLADNRVVNVSFNPTGAQTEVIIIFDAETQNSLELQKGGWQAILDNFKHYTETH
jgi:uncharacterized protein YndB with AHSA1/START domain